MDGGNSFNGSHEMTISHTNGTASENHRSVVTMAEVSSQEITGAETPQQPQAVSCPVEPQSLSTVHVQKPSSLPSLPSISSGVTLRPKSEVRNHAPKIRLLTRTPAMKSMSSPPPSFQMNEPDLAASDVGIKEPSDSIRNSMTHAQSVDSLDSSHSGHSGKLEDYFTSKNSVSREGSFDYTDSTGVDLEKFITQTLKNPRDKKMLLRLESDFTNFINDPSRPILHYPPMTSYHRMIVHRVAAYFGMDHNVDMTGKSVIMNKTMNTRIPEFKFREFLSRENSEEDNTGNGPRTILKRESMEEGTPPKVESPKPSSVVHPLEEKRSKSFEEREEEYSKARARIFNQESMSSQSSQSSKDGGDLEPIQILQATRDSETVEPDSKELPAPGDEQAPYTSEKTEEEEEDNPTVEESDEHKEEDVPKTSTVSQSTVTEKPQQQQQQPQKGYGGSKARQHSGSTPTLPSWAAEGAPLMPPTIAPGEFIFPYPSLPGIVPVMSQHSHKPLSMPEYHHPQPAGGVVWNFPVDAMQQPARPHAPAYITPQSGVQVMTPDGMAVYPAQYHTMATMKPTPPGHGAYMQHPQHQSTTPSQSVQQPVQVQSPPHPQPQMMIPQHYYGMQQPVYYMPHQQRLQYSAQQALDPNQRWPTPAQQAPQVAQSPTSSSYPDLTHQFSGMSLVQRPDVEAQQRAGAEAASQAAASYGGTQAQVLQAQQPHIQYVFVPPQGQYRPGVPVMAQQMPQQGSTQQASYVYGHNIYQGYPQYGLNAEPVLQPRSQTPPTPPRTTSPIISSPQYPHPVSQTGPNSQPMARPQQTITPPYHQRTPPQTPSARPFLLQGPHGIPIPPPHILPMGHATSGAAPQQIATSPSAYGFSQGQMFAQQPQQQVAQRKSPNERRVGKADVYIPDNTVKSQSSPVTSPSQGGNPGVQYWTGHNTTPPNAQVPPPRLDLNQQRFLQGQAVAHYQHQHQHQHAHNYQYQQFPKNKQRPYRQRQGSRPSSNDSSHNKRGGGGNNQGLSSQDTEKSSEPSSSITTSSGTGASQILEVYDYPEGIKNHQADLLFDELKKTGARIQWLSNNGPSSSPPQGGGSAVLLAIFSSSAQAQRALDTIKSSSFKLRVPPHHTVLQKSSDGNMKN